MTRTAAALVATMMLVVFLGCEGPAPAPPAPKTPPAGQAAPEATAPARPAPPTVQEPAGVGMGAKGHYGPGIITTPTSIYWRAQDRLAIMQIVHAMQLYVATHGEPPKTHDEFMEKIVKEGAIQLPTLPDGETYLYDPTQVKLPDNTGLMVQRPAP
ncbi:MAG: hypothetical protein JW809_03825 [Pirellulales bacterium]|nr:hypothetical protein [Pirellulales bacterium]